MSGTRMHRTGSIFSRVTGLLRSGVLRWEDRPLWYDVYVAFPPDSEPRNDHLHYLEPPKPLRRLYYREDYVRAMYFKYIEQPSEGERSAYANLQSHPQRHPERAQRFVEAYYKTAAQTGATDPLQVLRETPEFHAEFKVREGAFPELAAAADAPADPPKPRLSAY